MRTCLATQHSNRRSQKLIAAHWAQVPPFRGARHLKPTGKPKSVFLGKSNFDLNVNLTTTKLWRNSPLLCCYPGLLWSRKFLYAFLLRHITTQMPGLPVGFHCSTLCYTYTGNHCRYDVVGDFPPSSIVFSTWLSHFLFISFNFWSQSHGQSRAGRS